jgi:ribosome-binding factor A
MNRRTQRLGVQFKEEIGLFLQREVRDPRIGFVTVSRVEITDDLSYAKIWVSVMGSEKEMRDTMIGLHQAVPFVRKHMSKILKIRKIPELNFVQDLNLEHGLRIEKILNNLKEQGGLGDTGNDSEAESR